MHRPTAHPTSPRRRLKLALLAWVLLFAALAPAVSQLLAQASGSARWVEVCSARGMRWVALDTAAAAEVGVGAVPGVDPSEPGSSSHGASCPCCHLSQLGMAPPPVAWAPALLAVQDRYDATMALAAAPAAPAWRQPPSRAPPLAT